MSLLQCFIDRPLTHGSRTLIQSDTAHICHSCVPRLVVGLGWIRLPGPVRSWTLQTCQVQLKPLRQVGLRVVTTGLTWCKTTGGIVRQHVNVLVATMWTCKVNFVKHSQEGMCVYAYIEDF